MPARVVLVLLFAACGEDARVAQDTNGELDQGADLVETSAPETTDAQDLEAEVLDSDGAPTDTEVADVADVADVDRDSPLGGSRPARVVVPADYDHAVAHPLAILLHGYSASGAIQDAYLGFSQRAATRGLIAVIPDGTTNPGGQQFWNATPGWCCDFLGSGIDDAGYLLGLVTEAKARFNIDADRVYLMGHSNGGFMSYKMACEHADVFAAIVSIAGAMPLSEEDCSPGEAVSVLQVHGTLDAVISYDGFFGRYPSAPVAVERWAQHNGCADTTSVGEDKDYDNTIFGAETSVLEHRSCRAGAAVLWRMTGSAHVPAFSPAFMPAALDWLLAHPKRP